VVYDVDIVFFDRLFQLIPVCDIEGHERPGIAECRTRLRPMPRGDDVLAPVPLPEGERQLRSDLSDSSGHQNPLIQLFILPS